MNKQPERTVVYSWPGPPNITVSTEHVHHNGQAWLQHVVEGDDGGIGAVAVAVFDGRHLMVEHFRPVTGTTLMEFPRGFGGPPANGQLPEQHACADAERELMEETGIAARGTEFLGYIWPDSGLLGSKVAVVSIEAASSTPSGEPDAEIDSWLWVSSADLNKYIRSGRVSDGITLAAYALWTANSIRR